MQCLIYLLCGFFCIYTGNWGKYLNVSFHSIFGEELAVGSRLWLWVLLGYRIDDTSQNSKTHIIRVNELDDARRALIRHPPYEHWCVIRHDRGKGCIYEHARRVVCGISATYAPV